MPRVVSAALVLPIALALVMVLSPVFTGVSSGLGGVPALAVHLDAPGSSVNSVTTSSKSAAILESGEAALAKGEGPARGTPWSCGSGNSPRCGPAAPPSGHDSVAAPASPAPSVSPSANPTAVLSDLNWSNVTGHALDGYSEDPNDSFGASVAYDPLLGDLVMYGGGCNYCYSNQTWLYNGVGWFDDTILQEFLGNGNPPSLIFSSAAWDPQWKGIIVTGGALNLTSLYTDQTWLFNGTWWNETALVNGINSGPDSVHGSMAYDQAAGGLVYVNGCLDEECLLNFSETYFLGPPGTQWVYEGSGPFNPSFGGSMAYLPTDGDLIYYGGETFSFATDALTSWNYTWVMVGDDFDWVNWSLESRGDFFGLPLFYPGGGYGGAMTWDGQINAIVLVDGYSSSAEEAVNQTYIMGANLTWYPEIWFYNDAIIAPPAEYDGMMPSNSSAIAPVLIGGVSTTTGNFMSDMWVLEIPPEPLLVSISPSPADVGAHVEVFVENSVGSGSGPYLNISIYNFLGNYTWYDYYDANFTTYNAVTATFVYAGVSEWLVFSCASDFFDVVGCTVLDTLVIHANVTAAPSAKEVELGTATAFNSSAGLGTYPYSYLWNFGDGSPTVAGSSTDTTHTYAAAGNYTAWLNVSDVGGGYHNTTFKVEVVKDLELTAKTNITRTSLETDVGIPVKFSSDPTGGDQPYVSYAWAFGDTDTAATQDAVHAYATSGTFTASVTVTDSLSYTKEATLTVKVNPTLTGSVTASSLTPYTGATDTFTATPVGGTGPYTYAWTFGDSTTGTGAAPTHSYSTTGTFTVTVVIKDQFNETVTEKLTVTVSSKPSSPLLGGLTSGTGLYVLIAVIVIVVLAIAALAMRRRKKEPSSTPPAPWHEGPPTTGGAGGTPPSSPPPSAGGTPPASPPPGAT